MDRARPRRRRPVLFLALHALWQLALIHRVFRAGPLADIDSIAHVSYLRYFVGEFAPATASSFGYTPKYNLGAPFLLYNVPPGTCLAGAALVRLGLSPEDAIKALLVLAYLSVPPLAFAFARTSRPRASSLPYFAAVAVGLFSSDLFGLDFFFHNGMVNACLAVPLLLGAATALRWAWDPARGGGRGVVGAYAAAAVCFAALLVTHLLSAYFAGLAFVALLLGGGLSDLGRRALGCLAVVAAGTALAAFWWIPSAPFFPRSEAVFNWIRDPVETLSEFLDGSRLTSFWLGFAPSYHWSSNVGLAGAVLGAIGAHHAWRSRDPAMRGLTLFFALSFAVALGPEWTLGLGWLPGYPRLLWYRFVTPALLAWTILAGCGASRLWALLPAHRLLRHGPRLLVAGAFALCAVTLARRGARIETTGDYPAFMRDYGEVVAWMRAHADPRGRVFGEFLYQSDAVPSVNYLRQMLPVDTGLPEVGGWVYENSPASVHLVERGAFWWAPALLADDAARLALKYVVAGRPGTRRAFEADARWQRVVETPSLAVFEARDFAPQMATAAGRDVRVEREGYTAGGGYAYRLRVGPGPAAEAVLRANFSALWRAEVGDVPAPTRQTGDGFVALDVPAGPCVIDLAWDATELRRRGRAVSWSACGALLLAIVLARAGFGGGGGRGRSLEWIGRGAFAVVVGVAALFGRRNDLGAVRAGLPSGVTAERDPHDVDLGTPREREDGGWVAIEPAAWDAPVVRDGHAFRRPLAGSRWHATVRVGAGGSLRVEGEPAGAALGIALGDATTGEVYCAIEGRLGDPLTVPEPCRARGREGLGPGRALAARFDAGDAAIRRIAVQDAVVVVQAESFHNDLHGRHGRLDPGEAGATPENGLVVTGDAARGETRLRWSGDLPEGPAKVWMLLDEPRSSAAASAATLVVRSRGRAVGSVDGLARRTGLDAPAEPSTSRWAIVGEAAGGPASELEIVFARAPRGAAGDAAVDALAVEPLPRGP